MAAPLNEPDLHAADVSPDTQESTGGAAASAQSGEEASAGARPEPRRGLIRYVPNSLTIFRLLCLPVFFWLYGMQAPGFAWYAALLMWFAAWSDIADGYIARRYHVQSEFGRMLDPFVDRLFFLTVFSAYIYYGTMPWWSAAPVLARDAILMLSAVVLVGWRGERPEVMRLGKYTNFILMWAVGFFMIGVQVVAWPIYIVGAALYLVTGGMYIARYIEQRRVPRAG